MNPANKRRASRQPPRTKTSKRNDTSGLSSSKPILGERSGVRASTLGRNPKISEQTLKQDIPAITHYLLHESSFLDLVAIEVYQHLIERYGTELDQEMTSDTILTTLKNWVGEQCDRHNLWEQTAEDISSSLVSLALQAMQRDLGDHILESLDWEEFNQILFQYLFEDPVSDLKTRLQPFENYYTQALAQRIIQEMDLGHQSIAVLKRKLGLVSTRSEPTPVLIGQSLSQIQPIPEIASELPLLVKEGEDGQLLFSDQFQSDLWASDAREVAYLRYHSKQNRHQYLEHYITSARDIEVLPWELVEQIRLKFGLSAAKLQLLLSAYATQYPQWDHPFTLTAGNLVEALGWQSESAREGLAGTPLEPTFDQTIKTKATNLLYALSCVLVKLLWVDPPEEDSSLVRKVNPQPKAEVDQAQLSQTKVPHNQGRTPVGKLWEILITPQGNFDWQTGDIESANTLLLTIRPGLWVTLLDSEHDRHASHQTPYYPPTHYLAQCGALALRLLQLGAYSHELTIRTIIHMMLENPLRERYSSPKPYQVKTLLEHVVPQSRLNLAQSDIKQGQKLFEEWNIMLKILAHLHPELALGDENPLDGPKPDPALLYAPPYPKWLHPNANTRKPRGWIQTWLNQKLRLA